MRTLATRLGKNTISDGNAGLGTTFTAIANNMVQPGGCVALILPTASMMAGSFDAEENQPYSWQRLRNLIYDNYEQIIVVSIAQPEKKDSAFSADSDFADCMVIARRTRQGRAPTHRAHFVNLEAAPATKLEAQETVRAIKQAIDKTDQPDTWTRLLIGDDDIGFVTYENVAKNQRWTTLRVSNPTFVSRAKKLAQGELHLPQRAQPIAIPITPARHVAQVGPATATSMGETTARLVNAQDTRRRTSTQCCGTTHRKGRKPYKAG